MTSLFPSTSQSSTNLVQFKAGKCFREGTTNLVKPDLRKGLVYLQQGEDSLMHFFWKDRKTNQIEDDLIIFPDEAEFLKVEESKDRVFVLKFKSSSLRIFFWMQDKNSEQDEFHRTRVNEALNSPMNLSDDESESYETANSEIQSESTQVPPQAAETVQASNVPVSAGNDSDINRSQQDILRNLLSSINVPGGARQSSLISLSSILNSSTLQGILSQPEKCKDLLDLLPEGVEQSHQELCDTVRSPQFNQAVQTLSSALNQGQLHTLLHQLGLNPNQSEFGVEGLLNAIQEKVESEKKEDRMDES
ncbi:adhesion regulating molecule [Basidiobolus meristosporus CBS 931.73]|uniref:Adhesion regulating molecule n=1 Tax=Basidiobolus meristosporus CBS 931.73 TaxID=1314790 RepID=A0A1Y1X3A5_9FUNG|nr:adhesion regulating molecule [Basidiobolus meristosporus CBS 931.73]|eukprot:ORX80287.1 adhesion regulating molecule [Basidiobolus meristosporus CBS 931.73]